MQKENNLDYRDKLRHRHSERYESLLMHDLNGLQRATGNAQLTPNLCPTDAQLTQKKRTNQRMEAINNKLTYVFYY